MVPRIEVDESILERMTPEDRMCKAVAEMLIYQFEAEPSSGIITTGDTSDIVNRWTLARRFREFCGHHYPDLDPWRLWNWYRYYLIQKGRYARREDLNIQWFTGFRLDVPRLKYQHASESKPKPQRPKVELVEYMPEHDPGTNGFKGGMN